MCRVFGPHVCLCASCVQCRWRPEDSSRSPGTRVTDGCECLWVLGIEPRASGRPANALHCWPTSPSPKGFFILQLDVVLGPGNLTSLGCCIYENVAILSHFHDSKIKTHSTFSAAMFSKCLPVFDLWSVIQSHNIIAIVQSFLASSTKLQLQIPILLFFFFLR